MTEHFALRTDVKIRIGLEQARELDRAKQVILDNKFGSLAGLAEG